MTDHTENLKYIINKLGWYVVEKYNTEVFKNYMYWAEQYHLAINDRRIR